MDRLDKKLTEKSHKEASFWSCLRILKRSATNRPLCGSFKLKKWRITTTEWLRRATMRLLCGFFEKSHTEASLWPFSVIVLWLFYVVFNSKEPHRGLFAALLLKDPQRVFVARRLWLFFSKRLRCPTKTLSGSLKRRSRLESLWDSEVSLSRSIFPNALWLPVPYQRTFSAKEPCN